MQGFDAGIPGFSMHDIGQRGLTRPAHLSQTIHGNIPFTAQFPDPRHNHLAIFHATRPFFTGCPYTVN